MAERLTYKRDAGARRLKVTEIYATLLCTLRLVKDPATVLGLY